MVRTVINLDSELKAWLDQRARERRQPMTAVVREALAAYRAADTERAKPSRANLLACTRGIWQRGDGLEWQDHLRAEWAAR